MLLYCHCRYIISKAKASKSVLKSKLIRISVLQTTSSPTRPNQRRGFSHVIHAEVIKRVTPPVVGLFSTVTKNGNKCSVLSIVRTTLGFRMPETTLTNGHANANGHSGYEMADGAEFLFTSESVGEGHPG